ncbi:uncharacterized protein LOC26526946 [Drosophila erecta]|uniref:Uncharacterized protein n=1 Tax=Drosophila erecta TaxID=7220 RepID=A0A0Q5VUN0_DROER|nr:uncharacterized protein LOC26526946 [Drosophila erecta]KQS61947.1 uncharacterized protein Dere_GG27122 [Drosophila erecta]
MEMVHTAIGVAGILAMFMVVTRSVTQVGGLVLNQARDPIADLVTRGGPVADQLSAVEGETPLVEGDRMDGACSVVHSIGGKACALVGPFLPKFATERNSEGSSKDDEKDKMDSEQPVVKSEAPPPAELSEEE